MGSQILNPKRVLNTSDQIMLKLYHSINLKITIPQHTAFSKVKLHHLKNLKILHIQFEFVWIKAAILLQKHIAVALLGM